MRFPAAARVLRLVAGNLAVLLALLAVLEAGARVVAPAAEVALFDDPALRGRERPFVRDHPTRGFALAPGFRNELYSVNAAGFRGAELPADLGAFFVVLALGESTTFGFNVRDDETYPSYLQAYLREHARGRPVWVVNAGVPSYSSAQVLVTLEETLGRLRPDLVIVNAMWNDVWYSTLRHWYPEVLVRGRPAPWRRFLVAHSALYRALAAPRAASAAADVANPRALAHYRANLERIVGVCAGAGVRLAFMEPPFDPAHLPERGLSPIRQIHLTRPFLFGVARAYDDAMKDVARDHGIPVLGHPLALGDDGPGQRAVFQDILHPTAEGNARIARAVGEQLVARGLVE
jgi:lysophospholipase L1-like esterase